MENAQWDTVCKKCGAQIRFFGSTGDYRFSRGEETCPCGEYSDVPFPCTRCSTVERDGETLAFVKRGAAWVPVTKEGDVQ